MKKLIIAAIAMLAFSSAFAYQELAETNIVDVYDFKMSLKVPYVKNGVRTYSSQTLKGYLALEYNQFSDINRCYAKVTNTKTKTDHLIEFKPESFVRLGKSNKYTDHTVPAMALEGKDLELDGASVNHEFITSIVLAGSGSLKTTKITTSSNCCGTSIDYALTINKMSGNVGGIMDCNCDYDAEWDHTVGATRCKDYGMRESKAPFYGSWSMTWNKKYSDEITLDKLPVPSTPDPE